VPRYGWGCLAISWRLVFYEVYTKIERNALLWTIWVDFPYLIDIFCTRKVASLISLEKTPKGKLWATHFLLEPLSLGVVGVLVHLLRGSRRVRSPRGRRRRGFRRKTLPRLAPTSMPSGPRLRLLKKSTSTRWWLTPLALNTPLVSIRYWGRRRSSLTGESGTWTYVSRYWQRHRPGDSTP
jgi:hypothetical protein